MAMRNVGQLKPSKKSGAELLREDIENLKQELSVIEDTYAIDALMMEILANRALLEVCSIPVATTRTTESKARQALEEIKLTRELCDEHKPKLKDYRDLEYTRKKRKRFSK